MERLAKHGNVYLDLTYFGLFGTQEEIIGISQSALSFCNKYIGRPKYRRRVWTLANVSILTALAARCPSKEPAFSFTLSKKWSERGT